MTTSLEHADLCKQFLLSDANTWIPSFVDVINAFYRLGKFYLDHSCCHLKLWRTLFIDILSRKLDRNGDMKHRKGENLFPLSRQQIFVMLY